MLVCGSTALRAQPAGAIEEITVTAERREEGLQDTPVSVSAFTGPELESHIADDLTALDGLVPNLNLSTGTQGSGASFTSAVFIRGIGQPDYIVTTDPSIGLYVDGVYFGRTTGGVIDLLDIERVEVLRGPQGTLFGKNTIGGAINVISAGPHDELAGDVALTYGSYDRVGVRGDINVPLTNNLQGRFAVATNRDDGYGRRLAFTTGDTIGTTGVSDSVTGRARLRWRPGGDTEVNLSIDSTRIREPQMPVDIVAVDPEVPLIRLWNNLVAPPDLPYTSRFVTADDYASFATGPSRADMDHRGIGLDIRWRAGDVGLRSITGYREIEALIGHDGDGSPLRVTGLDRMALDQSQTSQELHLTGNAFENRLDWLAGVYYYDEQASDATRGHVFPGLYEALEASPALLGPTGPLGPCPTPLAARALPTPGPIGCEGNPNNVPLDNDFRGANDVRTASRAIFGHVSFALRDRWNVAAGIRYTREEKTHKISFARIDSGFEIAPPGTRREASWSAATPRAGVEFHATEDLMVYVSAARGFRSGGFNGRPFFAEAVSAFKPEYLWSYETGIKSAWFNRRLILNAAVFSYDYTDIQLTSNRATVDGHVAVLTENAAEAELEGLEIELHARPLERLDLTAGIGYTDAEFTKVGPDASITSDTRFMKTPEWDVSLGTRFRVAIGGAGVLSMTADLSYRSDYYNDVINSEGLKQTAFVRANTRLSFANRSGSWEVALFATNLTDARYITGGVGGLGTIGFDEAQYGRPREWGVMGKYGF